MLIVFAGLPGTGKTTIARAVAAGRSAVYLRIDEIEQALRSNNSEVGATGYAVAHAIAGSNLANGCVVVADCVNPVRESREGWRALAKRMDVALIEVEIICSDPIEHRRRVERRESDIAGLVPPDWDAVLATEYQPVTEPHLVVDTAETFTSDAVAMIDAAIAFE